MTPEEIDNRVKYHAPNDVKRAMHEAVRESVGVLAHKLNNTLPECREKDLMFDALDQVMFLANATIARNDEV